MNDFIDTVTDTGHTAVDKTKFLGFWCSHCVGEVSLNPPVIYNTILLRDKCCENIKVE